MVTKIAIFDAHHHITSHRIDEKSIKNCGCRRSSRWPRWEWYYEGGADKVIITSTSALWRPKAMHRCFYHVAPHRRLLERRLFTVILVPYCYCRCYCRCCCWCCFIAAIFMVVVTEINTSVMDNNDTKSADESNKQQPRTKSKWRWRLLCFDFTDVSITALQYWRDYIAYLSRQLRKRQWN